MDQTERDPRGAVAALADSIMATYDAYRQGMMTRMNVLDRLRESEMELEAVQDAVLLDPDVPLDGKNETIRGAQLRARTEDQYLTHEGVKKEYQRATMEVELRYELLRTMRCLASLQSGTSHA